MKNLFLVRTAILFTVMLIGTTVYGQQTARDYQSQIEDMNRQMVKNMLAGDVEKTLEMYTEDAISLPSNEPMLEGKEEIKKHTQEMATSGMKITSFEPKILKVIPEGKLITEIGTYKIKLTVPGTDSPVEDHGKYLTIWETQSDGSLKIKVETWNSDVNPMEQK